MFLRRLLDGNKPQECPKSLSFEKYCRMHQSTCQLDFWSSSFVSTRHVSWAQDMSRDHKTCLVITRHAQNVVLGARFHVVRGTWKQCPQSRQVCKGVHPPSGTKCSVGIWYKIVKSRTRFAVRTWFKGQYLKWGLSQVSEYIGNHST